MTPPEFQLDVSAANGRPQRLASLVHIGGREFRDRLDTNSANSRKSFISKASQFFFSEPPEFAWLEEELVRKADEADDRIDAKLDNAAVSAPEPGTQSDAILDLVSSVDLFHDPSNIAYARVQIGDASTVMRLRSRAFRTWLSHQYFASYGKVPSSQPVQDAINALEGKACFHDREEHVYVRCAEASGKIYIDLCNAAWQVVEVSDRGWSVLDRSPVMFRRSAAMLPLPVPEDGGRVEQLRTHLNIGADDWPLVLGWLVAALRPTGPYPILAVHGEQGSAKSTACRMLRELVDPNVAPLRCEPRDHRDLAIAANNSWVLAIDNVSSVKPWLSDALCRLSTGGGFATRALFENDEEAIFDAQRPAILNGIEDVANRSDLLDRSIAVNLPRIDETRRMVERDVWERFRADQPRILGALLTAVSTALANIPRVKLLTLPRMADFAIWVTAAESAVGLEVGEFSIAYSKNRQTGNDLAIEDSLVARALRELLDCQADDGWGVSGHWSGTATELLEELEKLIGDNTRRQKEWPKSARRLSGHLKRIAPNLRAAGIEVEFERRGKSGTKVWTLIRKDRVGDSASAASANLEPATKGGEHLVIPSVDVADAADAQSSLTLLLHR